MIRFPVTVILTYIFWILLTFSFSIENLVMGLFVALVVSFISSRFLFSEVHAKILNPIRWARFISYIFVWIYYAIVAHLDVMYRIVTGRINPVVVKLPTKMKTDIGKTLLANSITLTPGTVTLWTEKNNLYVHCLNKKKNLGAAFERIGPGVTE